jgi:hypothetical protein
MLAVVEAVPIAVLPVLEVLVAVELEQLAQEMLLMVLLIQDQVAVAMAPTF